LNSRLESREDRAKAPHRDNKECHRQFVDI
jgi:hypothetical protein